MTDAMSMPPPIQPARDVPNMEALDPASGDPLVLQGITRMIQPTILQAGEGGFITIIPGVGVHACSTMEEVMDFVQKHATTHFQSAPNGGMPRILMKAFQNGRGKITDMARHMDFIFLPALGLAALLGWVLVSGFMETKEIKNGRPSLLSDRAGHFRPVEQRVEVLPEVHMLQVRPASYDGGAERSVQNGYLLPVRPLD